MPDQPNPMAKGPFTLSVTYTSTSSSGNEPFSVLTPVAPPSTTTTASPAESKSAYLHGLRAGVFAAQETVNRELTARMEQDNLKARELANGVVNDSKEEENYGEEVAEEED